MRTASPLLNASSHAASMRPAAVSGIAGGAGTVGAATAGRATTAGAAARAGTGRDEPHAIDPATAKTSGTKGARRLGSVWNAPRWHAAALLATIRALRAVLTMLLLVGAVGRAHAQPAPLRVDIECEQIGRTKTCPAFLLGFVDANKVLLSSPREGADVVVYATANAVALADQIHLRFVGHVPGAPEVVELDAMVRSRSTDDQQRAILEPVFLRGIALFVAARYPDAVTVTLTTPKDLATTLNATSLR